MELTRHRVVLRGDRAYSMDEYSGECQVQILELGTESSYGAHVLDVDLQDGWAGLAVVGYFDNGEDCADSLLDNGVMEVPPSASKNPGTHTITFTGSDSDGYRVSTKIPYRIRPKGCTTGSTPPPDPDVFQQFVEQLIAAQNEYFAGGNLNDVWTKLIGGKQGWAKPQGGGGGGTSNYNDLSNKPQINGNELIGNKTWKQLGFPDVEALAAAAAQSAQAAQEAAGVAGSAAGAASGSATAAQGSASTASTKASEADTSAQAAAQSASAAEQSKTAAAGSASAADQSAQQAADAAGAADGSASAAAGYASAAASDAGRAEAAANKIPTPAGSADAGKFLAVNSTGDGYELKTGGGGGTTDYNELENKPSLNGVTMEGDKTAEDYGLATKEELPKQATDTVAGIAKFKPIAEQGNNVPASILPNGTVVVPPGGGSGGGINPTLLATLNGDGASIELTADVDLTDGLYTVGVVVPANTQDDNKGQTLYARVGDTGIFGKGIRTNGVQSNVAAVQTLSVITFFVKDSKMYMCATAGLAFGNLDFVLFGKDGTPIVKQKIALYSQTSKPVPVGAYAMLWRLG